MASLREKVLSIINAKSLIRAALQRKNMTVSENTLLKDYPDIIDAITIVDNQEKHQTITSNGTTTITPDSNKTGLSRVIIDTNINTVKNQSKVQNITSNGSVTVKPDSGYTGLSQVTISTNVTKTLTGAGTSVLSAYRRKQ